MGVHMIKILKTYLSLFLCVIIFTFTIRQVSYAAENKAYMVSFDANGGEVDTNSTTVTFGSKYGKLPKPTRKNYDFAGWYTYKSGGIKITADSTVKINSNHTLYANWKGKESSITLYPTGGTLTEDTIRVYYGSKYKLPTPIRENYTFEGWYTSEKSGDKIPTFSLFDENSKKKLYAHWSEKVLKITFIAYNGENYTKEVTCGKKYGELPIPEKKGQVFHGWYTWDDYLNPDANPVNPDTIVDEKDSLKLFARWVFSE
ncbi:MAG: internalin-like protein [Anaerocolumna sp.]|nr:internalin-like protein [Anaerocolumna sp.]